jgi:hypothetical protein
MMTLLSLKQDRQDQRRQSKHNTSTNMFVSELDTFLFLSRQAFVTYLETCRVINSARLFSSSNEDVSIQYDH